MSAPTFPRAGGPARRLDEMRRLARDLGGLVTRGAHQRFFVSPVLPTAPLTSDEIAAAWADAMADMAAGRMSDRVDTYVHIPFCTHKCTYCVYYSEGNFDPAMLDAYLARLDTEIEFYRAVLGGRTCHTLYVGGGTPTVLDEAQLERLLGYLGQAFPTHRGGERCFECNPLTATPEKIAIFAAHGFNRASFGVQTLEAGVLDGVARGYQTRGMIGRTIDRLRAHRLRVSVDLIHGLPGSRDQAILDSLDSLLSMGAGEVTVYALSPHTPDAQVRAKGRPGVPLRQIYDRIAEVAARHGHAALLTETTVKLDPVPETSIEPDTDRLTVERFETGKTFAYDDTSPKPFSLLAIGPTTRAAIYDRLDYQFDRYSPATPFDPAVPIAQGRRIPPLEGRRRFITRGLAREGFVDLVEYRQRFGEDIDAAFPEAAELVKLGGLERSRKALAHTSLDPVERFAVQSFFVDDPMLRVVRLELDRDAEARDVRRLDVTAMGTTVRFAICRDLRGGLAYHRNGGFVVRVDGDTELSEEGRMIAKAFVRLFDRVLARGDAATADELRDRLIATSAGLKLVFKSRDGTRPEPFELAACDAPPSPDLA